MDDALRHTEPATLSPPDPPVRFTVAQVVRMVEAEILDPDRRWEVIDGEVFQVSPQSAVHVRAISTLLRPLFAHPLPATAMLCAPGTVRSGERTSVEPDIMVALASANFDAPKRGDIAFTIEVAWSSHARDLGPKRAIYARLGVETYWVVDLKARRLHVATAPGDNGYLEMSERPFSAEEGLPPPFDPTARVDLTVLPSADPEPSTD